MKRGGEGRGEKKTVSSSPCEPADLRDGTIIFLTGGRGKIFTFKHCFICSSCCKQFFGVSVFLQTHLFVLIYNLFQCFQPLQKINFKIFQPPPPATSSKKLWSVPKSVPWVPRTFLARFPVSVKQGG